MSLSIRLCIFHPATPSWFPVLPPTAQALLWSLVLKPCAVLRMENQAWRPWKPRIAPRSLREFCSSACVSGFRFHARTCSNPSPSPFCCSRLLKLRKELLEKKLDKLEQGTFAPFVERRKSLDHKFSSAVQAAVSRRNHRVRACLFLFCALYTVLSGWLVALLTTRVLCVLFVVGCYVSKVVAS